MAKVQKKARTSAGRPQQPKCSHCNKALYKRMDAGAVKTEDPYGWCRNASCATYNQDQSGSSRFPPLDAAVAKQLRAAAATVEAALGAVKAKSIAPPAVTTKSKTILPPAPKVPKSIAPPAIATKSKTIPPPPSKASKSIIPAPRRPSAPPPADEPAEVSKTRRRIKRIIEHEGDNKRSAIGVALALLNAESGSHEQSNRLIRELKLSEYGIEASTGKRKRAQASATA